MKVLLINIDSKLPNIALKKIEKFHLQRGDQVIWDFPLLRDNVDKIYVSCIFTKNKHLCLDFEGRAEIGGSGYDLLKKLPKEIENIKLKINYGFATRGCIRKCEFCFVPKKEGNIHVVGDLYDIWDGKSKEVVLLDNNILAMPKHFKLICKQARDNDIRLDFNQGLDIRLLTEDLAKELKATKLFDYRFAFDDQSQQLLIESKLPLLVKYKIRALWYVLVGFNSCIKEEIKRIDFLLYNKQRVYVMRHDNCKDDKRYVALATWINSPIMGKGVMLFTDFLNDTQYGKNYKMYFDKSMF